jgi:hypothetical protein
MRSVFFGGFHILDFLFSFFFFVLNSLLNCLCVFNFIFIFFKKKKAKNAYLGQHTKMCSVDLLLKKIKNIKKKKYSTAKLYIYI